MRSEPGTRIVEKGYKVTEVGVIPEEWDACQLKDISDFITKGATPTTYGFDWQDEGILFLKSDCITPSGFSYGQCKFISAEAHRSMKRSVVKAGDILMSITGYIGKVAVVPEYVEEANINQHIARIRVTSSKHDSRFTYYSLLAPGQTKLLVKDCTGQAYPQLSLEQVRNVTIYAPPLPEQEKIAEVLSTVDEHMGETEDLIEKTETLKKGMMQRLLTRGIGHTEFKDTEIGRIPAEWEVASIAHLGTIIKGKGINRDSVQSEGFPCVRYGEIYTTYDYVVRKCYSYISDETAAMSTPIRMGDLLFTGSGETVEDIGKAVAYMLDQPGYAGGDILILHPNSSVVVPLFLPFQWDTQIVRLQRKRSGQGASIVHLYPDALKRIQVALPPLPEQREIADILTAIDDRIEEHRSKLEALTRLKSGLMQQLLTGRIRVKL